MNKVNLAVLILSISGLMFSGYLSSYKILNQSCALGESCPYFMGLPACYFGFIMYFTLTIFSAALVTKLIKKKWAISIILIVSFIGILFSGYFTLLEIPVLLESGIKVYTLGLPTCAFGLILYTLIFSLVFFKKFHK